MFKNKHLKQLRKIQLLIRHYKVSIEKLKSPVPDSLNDKFQVFDVLKAAALGHSFNPSELLELSNVSVEYLSQLGLYLMNVADYVDTLRVYQNELKRLKNEERILKEKLGID